MSVARVTTIQPQVLAGTVVTIEADISRGLHAFSIVGLAGKAIDESKDRISSAIKHSGFASPKTKNQKITISLSPADVKKDGPLFDLPVAVAYLIAAEEIVADTKERILIGELGLDGSVRTVKGVLNCVLAAKQAGYNEIIVPSANATEAALVSGITVYGARTLQEVIAHIKGVNEGTRLHLNLAQKFRKIGMKAQSPLKILRGKRAPNADLLLRPPVDTM